MFLFLFEVCDLFKLLQSKTLISFFPRFAVKNSHLRLTYLFNYLGEHQKFDTKVVFTEKNYEKVDKKVEFKGIS